MKYKKLTNDQKVRLSNRIKLLLFAGIDYCKNINEGKEYWFSPFNPYYCEAFGILQALDVLQFGYFGPDNIEGNDFDLNLKFWFNQIKKEVELIAEDMGEYEAYIWSKENLKL